MRVLIIDTDCCGLDLAYRCAEAGHDVKWFIEPDKGGYKSRDGEGFPGITRVPDWKPEMKWAKEGLIVNLYNDKYLKVLDQYKADGYPVFSPSLDSAKLEINRGLGMKAMKEAGLNVPTYQTFNSLEEAEAYQFKHDDAYVFKTMGDEEDKSLSYVASSPAEMIETLRQWQKDGMKLKGPCMLQEKIDGIEMGVSGWFGLDGWMPNLWNENFEYKKLMSGNIGPNCFTPDAEVLTRSGWKLWPDVTMEDEICTLKNGEIVYENPIQVVVGDFDGDLIGWKSGTVDILVTPGHNMYVQDDHERKPFFFESAIETGTKNRKIMRSGGQWEGKSIRPFLPDWYRGTECQWAALVGIYIADGYCHKNSVVFGNCPEHKQKEFSLIIEKAGFEPKIYGRDLYINHPDLTALFKTFGRCDEKFVVSYLKEARKGIIESFLKGYGLGDGNRRHNNLIFTTVSKKLKDDLQELLLKTGRVGTVNARDRRNGPGHFIKGYLCLNKLVAFDISVADRNKAKLRSSMVYRKSYRGKVYCVTVSSHVIYTRRNGKPCWIGQTGEQGSALKYVETSKLAEEILVPLTRKLLAVGHFGDCDINTIIDKKGVPWVLEFTMRFGYPAWQIMCMCHLGDPAQWMADWVRGKDSLEVSFDTAIGVLATMPPYPNKDDDPEKRENHPIYGADEVWDQVSPWQMMIRKGLDIKQGKTVETDIFATTGVYVLLTTGLDESVQGAAKKAYQAMEKIRFKGRMYRDDIGESLKDDLPKLHKLGYAMDWRY